MDIDGYRYRYIFINFSVNHTNNFVKYSQFLLTISLNENPEIWKFENLRCLLSQFMYYFPPPMYCCIVIRSC